MARAAKSTSVKPLSMLLAVVAAAAIGLVVSPAADAATITYSHSGGAVIYSAGPGEALDTTVGYEANCVGSFSCVVFNGDPTTLGDTTAGGACASVSTGMSCVLNEDFSGVEIVGGPGNDAVTFYAADIGGFPAATPYRLVATGNGGDDTLIGGDGDEILGGGDGADRLTGRGGDDTLEGGEGNDLLSGDADDQYSDLVAGGNDILLGGGGDDRLVGDGSAAGATIGHDLLDGGPGHDTVTSGWYRFDGHGADEDPPPTVTLDGLPDDGRPAENDNVVGVEHVSTGYQPATSQPGTYVGTAGPDELDLLFANGIVVAGAGADKITGSDSADSLDGGSGDDQISGGFGDDVITGGPGQDDIGGDRTAACFYGPIYGTCTIGSGNDTIYAQDGEKDTVDCGPGTDTAYVDSIDVTSGCETVQIAAAAASAPTDGGPVSRPKKDPPVRATPKPRLRVAHLRLGLIARQRAIHLRCGLTRPGRCTVRAWIAAGPARKLHLETGRHRRPFSLGVGTVKLPRRGTAAVVVHIRPKAAARLRHARSLQLMLTVTARDETGRSTLTRHYRVRG